MTAIKNRKKSRRFRGSKTHGWGSMKKHRGAGHRGGRGRAGSGKRGDAKKPTTWANKPQKGFASISEETQTINVGHLNSIAQRLVREGSALEQQGSIVINLREMGITKLLGAGRVTHKLKVGAQQVSPKAKEKIEAAGGSIDAKVTDKAAVLKARAEKKSSGKKSSGKKSSGKKERKSEPEPEEE